MPDLETPDLADADAAPCGCGCSGRPTGRDYRDEGARVGPIAALRRLKMQGTEADSLEREEARDFTPQWFDHCYTIVRDGIARYVCEPYGIDEEAVLDLALLARAGWSIDLTASQARHYPGRTTAIEMTPPQKAMQ